MGTRRRIPQHCRKHEYSSAQGDAGRDRLSGSCQSPSPGRGAGTLGHPCRERCSRRGAGVPGVLPSPASTAMCRTDGRGAREVGTDPQAPGFGAGSWDLGWVRAGSWDLGWFGAQNPASNPERHIAGHHAEAGRGCLQPAEG